MATEIIPGQAVRYGRTGTVGTITRIEEIGGVLFGCIDTTDLLYRIDLLTPVELREGKVVKVKKDARESITEERLRETVAAEGAWLNVDGACEGGG
ncbi:DUF2098 family protein [Methanocalculus sp.]|uniref:DUF2098 domain-containing protein n=1 Tax=Methanocalculus sp. TaxID=2004547 RepID=UPI00261C21BB|nr:DUF2098 family protein [Methanocalculus sp.]MDG6249798.1 DUF2098 family protein [Methanocalculus sp.]